MIESDMLCFCIFSLSKSCCVDLWGETEGGKSVTLMLAASVWANPAESAYIGDFKTTDVALEAKANMLNHLPMILDDTSKHQLNFHSAGLPKTLYMLIPFIPVPMLPDVLKQTKQKKKQEFSSGNNYTNFDTEGTDYENMYCGTWIATETGIYAQNMGTVEQIACYHPILPIERLKVISVSYGRNSFFIHPNLELEYCTAIWLVLRFSTSSR